MSRAFISYSSKDSDDAARLQTALKREGVDTWRDRTDIPAGAVWSRKIEEALREAVGLIVLISPSSARSKWVVYEYAFATARRIPVIGVLTHGAKVPRPLSHIQMIEGPDPKAIAAALAAAKNRSLPSQPIPGPHLVAKFTEINGGYAARKLDQYAARKVIHLRAVHSTCF